MTYIIYILFFTFCYLHLYLFIFVPSCVRSGGGYEEFTSRDLSKAPGSWGMAAKLLPHQARALACVRALATRGLGSVLSDEGGTGKVRTRENIFVQKKSGT